jgi:hypothetical protein
MVGPGPGAIGGRSPGQPGTPLGRLLAFPGQPDTPVRRLMTKGQLSGSTGREGRLPMNRNLRRGFLAAAAVPVLLAGAAGCAPGAAAGCAPGPSAAATVSGAGSHGGAASVTVAGVLNAVAATSARDAWAVGSIGRKTLIVHWDGTSWKRVPSPNPHPRFGDGLASVAAGSAGNAWAVGGYTTHRRHVWREVSFLLRWNGTSWKQVRFAHPRGHYRAVAATSARNAWVVGFYYVGTAVRTLILHWNGTAWKQVPSRLIGGPACCADLAVAATSARDAWAVGIGPSDKTLMLRWNGTSWNRVPSPTPTNGNDCAYGTYLSAVAATSPRNAWAVGVEDCDTLILHWDGTSWRQVPSPSPTCSICAYGDNLDGVAATSACNAWAFGAIGHANGAGSLLLQWDGTAWTQVPSPTPDPLTAVDAVSARDAWAISLIGNPNRHPKTMILHWNGTAWQ